MRSVLAFCLLLWLGLGQAWAVTTFDPNNKGPNITLCNGNEEATIGPCAGGNVTFTPLHTYYMAATGCSDTNSGTSAGSPWCSPNHTSGSPAGFTGFVCGDVILAAAGTYNGDMGTWGPVGVCPSLTGGIDGNGLIYAAVLLCAGTDLTSCKINCATAQCNGTPGFGPQVGINVTKSNWSVQGWNITCNGLANCEAMQASGSGTGCTAVTSHISFINNLTYDNGQGFDTQACNTAFGPDYVAVVGNVTQNSVLYNQSGGGFCIGAIDIIAPGVSDSDTTHTHFYVYTNYSFNNIATACDSLYDGEDYLVDSIDNNGVQGIIVQANNIGFVAERNCFNFDDNGNNLTKHPTIKVYNNTCTNNNQRDSANPGGTNGDFLMCCGSYAAWNFQIFNNIFYSPYATNPQTGSEVLYAMQVDAALSLQIGGQVRSGANNIIQGTPSPAHDIVTNDGASAGINTSQNPSFANLTDLLANRIGVPTCTGFINTTGCLGWNANTQTLTPLTIIADLQAGCAACGGKGFQNPSTNCSSQTDLVTDYPTWLKGLVYLHYNSGTGVITENADLATKPCGM